VRRKVVVPRTSIKLAAAVVAAGLAASACSSTRMGAAAITNTSRITTGNLTAEVGNLNSAYSRDKGKGVKPQRPTSQETQQVLSWLILFQVYDKMAAQHNISVTPAQQEQQEKNYTDEASSYKMNPAEFWSAYGALPPDLLPQFYQAAAIGAALQGQADGGKSPSSAAGKSALQSTLTHDQCLAAKDLNVNVNPQYGEYDYSDFNVVPAPPTLAADPTPSASGTPPVLTPPC
jgi:hypothetical protein